MRHELRIETERDREKLLAWCKRVPLGWRVEFKDHKRTTEQNARFWEMLARVADRLEINGRKYSQDQWKAIAMQAMGRQTEFLPTWDGASFFPSGFRSSDLSVQEMADLQTFIEAECAARGVDLWQ